MAAAAASTFAGGGSAEAEIHYSGNVFTKLTDNAQASLPLSNGASLVFVNIDAGTIFWQFFYFSIKGVTSGSAREGRTHHWVSNLPSGANVSAGRFYSVAGDPDHGVVFENSSDGYFTPHNGTRGYIGFRFNTGNGTQYGWARIQTRLDFSNGNAHETIKDYAWGDPGDVILTGQKHSPRSANAYSIAGSLGLLAFGAEGVDAWRTPRMPKSN